MTRNCGCSEEPLKTSDCTPLQDCGKEPCSEMFCEECIIHCQPEISVPLGEGDSFVVKQGDRYDTIIQRLMLAFSAPSCLLSAAYGLRLIRKTDTTMTIAWLGDGTYDYTLYLTNSEGTVAIVMGKVKTWDLTNLLPDTEYTFYITTQQTLCQSVEMKLKTNISS